MVAPEDLLERCSIPPRCAPRQAESLQARAGARWVDWYA
jgi:hypothetical protein